MSDEAYSFRLNFTLKIDEHSKYIGDNSNN